MFFTRIGKAIAHLIFWFSTFRVALGLVGAYLSPDQESNRAFAGRYLAAATTGEAINQGLTYILFALALGVLTEISSR